jgi:hypothetical protein
MRALGTENYALRKELKLMRTLHRELATKELQRVTHAVHKRNGKAPVERLAEQSLDLMAQCLQPNKRKMGDTVVGSLHRETGSNRAQSRAKARDAKWKKQFMKVAEEATKAAKDHKLGRLHKLHKKLLLKAEQEMGCRRESARVCAAKMAYAAAAVAFAAAKQAKQLELVAFVSVSFAINRCNKVRGVEQYAAVIGNRAARVAMAAANVAAQQTNEAMLVRTRDEECMRREEEATRMLCEELHSWEAFHGRKKHGWLYRLEKKIEHKAVALEHAIEHVVVNVEHAVVHEAHVLAREFSHSNSRAHPAKSRKRGNFQRGKEIIVKIVETAKQGAQHFERTVKRNSALRTTSPGSVS